MRPGAVYLVDALCAKINDDFAAALRKKDLPEKYKKAPGDTQRWNLVLEGRKEFGEIAGKVSSSWKAEREIAQQLTRRARYRGELVFFDEVVTFVKKPRAAFRSLQRIDGEDLLNQIAKGVREPTIRIYAPPAAKERILTKREIVARLAARERTNLSTVEHFLDGLARIAQEELGSSGPGAVWLPGIGTVRAGAGPSTACPATRQKLEAKPTL